MVRDYEGAPPISRCLNLPLGLCLRARWRYYGRVGLPLAAAKAKLPICCSVVPVPQLCHRLYNGLSQSLATLALVWLFDGLHGAINGLVGPLAGGWICGNATAQAYRQILSGCSS